jgi:hypothetical protein
VKIREFVDLTCSPCRDCQRVRWAWRRCECRAGSYANAPLEDVTYSVDPMWLKIQALERACWSRKWADIKRARKAIEADLGKRPPVTLSFTMEDR